MFPEDATSAVESYGVDATVEEREAKANDTKAMPPGIVVVLRCRAEKNVF